MNSRPPPPQGAPPTYAFVSRVYPRNLRPIVIGIASISALWALFDFIGYFRSVNTARQEAVPKLATFSIVLGALYAAMFAFEVFGVFAAITQRVPLVRTYALLSVATALIIVAAGLIRVVVHFTLKNDIIDECTGLSENSTVSVYPFGFFGPVSHDFIDHDDAVRWCTRAWDHDSWADIVSLLISIILAGLFTMIAFAYYRQVLDPSSPANASRVPPSRFGAPSHYNPPYNASVPNLGYGYNTPYAGGPSPEHGYQAYPSYAPPSGPPPTHEGYDGKPPDYLGGAGPGYGAEKADDPFADFEDGPSRREERDVTSRPGPGGRETF